MSEETWRDKAALLQRGSLVFAAGMAVAIAALVVEASVIRMFGKHTPPM